MKNLYFALRFEIVIPNIGKLSATRVRHLMLGAACSGPQDLQTGAHQVSGLKLLTEVVGRLTKFVVGSCVNHRLENGRENE